MKRYTTPSNFKIIVRSIGLTDLRHAIRIIAGSDGDEDRCFRGFRDDGDSLVFYTYLPPTNDGSRFVGEKFPIALTPDEAAYIVDKWLALACQMPEQDENFIDGLDGSVDRGFILETDEWGRATTHDPEAPLHEGEEWYTAFRVRGQWAQWGK